ncbi:MAG: hypothetical protein LQ352_005995, partial [Teloschistes flavicans]
MTRTDADTYPSSSSAPPDSHPNGGLPTEENGCHINGDHGSAGVEPIAVIGMDLKFPGDAASAESFFDMLKQGRSALSDVPKDRYNVDAFFHPDQERPGVMNVKKAHFIQEDISKFDAPFFSITPAEAACMDPQQRGLLETVYRALENAGVPFHNALGTKTSVYVGCFTREYEQLLGRDGEMDLKYIATGTGTAMLSNRLSWFYDFRGPSLTIDTACSSSLNACHLACASLRSGESSMALVGGCNLFYNPDTVVPLSSLGFLSPDGKCYSFDHRANGYSRGEGYGIILLKRLKHALRDKNTIRAIVRSTASNQDGKSPGITQPTQQAQMSLIREAYATAGLDLGATRYFEAHGTGTPVGDPIEAAAISGVFDEHRSQDAPLYIGALKSNIGHLEGAAGIAALMKAVLVLENGIIPPNIWFEKPNIKIPVDKWNIKFPIEATPWPDSGLRRVSVNAFGYGGSNAHVVLDDARHYLEDRGLVGIHRTVELASDPVLPVVSNGYSNKHIGMAGNMHLNGFARGSDFLSNGHEVPNGTANGHVHANGDTTISSDLLRTLNGSSDATRPRVFVWSSFDEAGIKRLRALYQHYLSKHESSANGQAFLDDLCYSLACKRTSWPWRSFAVAASIQGLLQTLNSTVAKPIRSSNNIRVGLVFTGQGAQWAGMGRELMAYPTFKESLDDAEASLRRLGCKWSLIDEFLKHEKVSRINDPIFSQPICAALQIALVELLHEWGVQSHAVIGHSSGEIAAAFATGGLSKESALKVAYYRGSLSGALAQSSLQPGCMMSVGLSPDDVELYLTQPSLQEASGMIAIGCYNSPTNVTMSGSKEKIDALKRLLDADGVFARKLKVDNAYHSQYMEAIAQEYSQLIADIQPGNMTRSDSLGTKFYSSVYARQVPLAELCKVDYWIANLVSPVRFAESMRLMITASTSKAKKLGAPKQVAPISHVLEVGPHAALQGPIRENATAVADTKSIGYSSMLKRGSSALETSLDAIGWLHCSGSPVDLAIVNNRGATEEGNLLVDLPAYPFNHEVSHWTESRLSKNFRFRKVPRLELLGAPVNDWDPSEAVWRNFLRVSESPWIKDHRITGSILYPGAGMLVMAIEAQLQLADHARAIKGFRIKDACFHNALTVPTTAEGIETHFYLRPYRDSLSSTASAWNEFRLCSYDKNEWREHCRGLVSLEYDGTVTAVDNGFENRESVEACRRSFADAQESCKTPIDSKQLYEHFSTVGLDFGPTFQCLRDVRYSHNGEAVALLQTNTLRGHVQPHVIHPTTLDAMFQVTMAALTKGGRDMVQVLIPTVVRNLWLSNEVIAHPETMNLHAKAGYLGFRQAEASAIALDCVTGEPLATIEGFQSTAVSGRDEAFRDTNQRQMCFNIDWKPDMSLLSQDEASAVLIAPENTPAVVPSLEIDELEQACFFFISDLLGSLSDAEVSKYAPHYQKYVEYAKHQLQRYEDGVIPHGRPEWKELAKDKDYVEQLLQRIDDRPQPDGKLLVAVGRNLKQLLSGEVGAIELLFNSKLLENVYRNGIGACIGYEKLNVYVDALAHKNPDLQILEIGAGTGGATLPVIQNLMRHGDNETGTPRFSHFDFTDISSGFFEKAKELFDFAAERMAFRVLDIETDPVTQGFETARYDLIVASNVLHATKDLQVTLSHTRKLLKPGGKLVLYEMTNPDVLRPGFIFGIFPGWWLGEESNRKWGALMSQKDWDSALRKAAFSGVDISLQDFPGMQDHLVGVMVATATESSPPKEIATAGVVIVAESRSPIQGRIADELTSRLEGMGVPHCELVSPEELNNTYLEHKVCVYLPELERSILSDISDQDYDSLKKMVSSTNGLLWLTHGGYESDSKPEAELVTGFSRCMRSENPSIKFITLSLESLQDSVKIADTIAKVYGQTLQSAQPGALDRAFVEKNGVLHIGRTVEANYLNAIVKNQVATGVPEPYEWGQQPLRPLALGIATPGLLDTLQFSDDLASDVPLAEGEVEIQVQATGLNFLDVMVSLGQVSGDFLGVECAGIVSRVGRGTDFEVGDRVCALFLGCFKTFARGPQDAVVKIPDDLSFTVAASLPVIYATAYYGLYDLARIQQGESVLIHWGAGGVGQAAIQLAKLIGAEVFVTVGSLEKRDLIREQYGIPHDHIFSSRDLSFAQGIRRMTKGHGVDVVLNSMSGQGLRASWDCIAPFGRFIEIGKVDIYSAANLSMYPFKRNVMFASLDLVLIARTNTKLLKKILEGVMHLVQGKKITECHPLHVFSYAEIEESFRLMQSGKHIGKIVLEPKETDVVKATPNRKPTYQFDASATYLISGGLGGLGRSMARWMVSRGARNLILLSRFGPRNDASKLLVTELESQGVRVLTPSCDVSDKDKLAAVLEDCAKHTPPVKGCIQGSMVLK